MIAAFAVAIVLQFFIEFGAKFHSLGASLEKVAFAVFDLPDFINLPDEAFLVCLPPSAVVCICRWIGYLGMFRAFQTSNNLDWAFNWLTDRNPVFLALSLLRCDHTVLSL